MNEPIFEVEADFRMSNAIMMPNQMRAWSNTCRCRCARTTQRLGTYELREWLYVKWTVFNPYRLGKMDFIFGCRALKTWEIGENVGWKRGLFVACKRVVRQEVGN